MILKVKDWNFSAQDVDDFLTVMADSIAACGHRMAISKVAFLPLSSEFVQTHAQLGFYVPKDHIMMIPSENPRTIDDQLGFSESMRRLLCSKISRAYSEGFAMYLCIYLLRHITSISSRQTNFKFEDRFQVVERSQGQYDPEIKVREIIARYQDTFLNYEDIWDFHFSPIVATFPRDAGGIGLHPSSLQIINSPSLYIYEVTAMNRSAAELMLKSYYFLRKKVDNLSSSGIDDVSFNRDDVTLLTPESLFSQNVQQSLNRLKDLDLRHLNAEAVPSQMMREGIKLERFMMDASRTDRDNRLHKFLESLRRTGMYMKFDTDEYLLGLSFQTEACDILDRSSPIVSLDTISQNLIMIYGMALSTGSQIDRREKMRVAISRDPVLKNLRSPEQINGIMDRFAIDTANERDLGYVLLANL